MHELELKLAVDDPFELPEFPPEKTAVADVQELPAQELRATYHDTPDLRLIRSGMTLRYRSGEYEQPGWDLKLPSSREDAISREELHFEGGASSIPEQVKDLITAFARSARVTPMARLRTKRRRWQLRDGEGQAIAELTDDRVSVLDGRRVVERFREIEIESRGLDAAGLRRIAMALEEAGAATLAPVPKVVRALGARAAAPPDLPEPADLSPSGPAALVVQAAMVRGAQRVLAYDPGTRLGDVEALHQMRVGARRLRSDLRTFSTLVDAQWANSLKSELRWLGRMLGDVRDLDVMQARLRTDANGLSGLEPLHESLEQRHTTARQALLEALRSPRYLELLETLISAARSPTLSPSAWEPSHAVLPPLAENAWQKLAKEARSVGPSDPDQRYHVVRIRAKRSRYAAEAIAPALGPDRAKDGARFAKRAAAVQDLLGILQDAAAAQEIVHQVVRERPSDTAFVLAAGRLIERQELAAQDVRKRFARTWHKLDNKKTWGWLAT